jgi:hypothetical protein
MKRTTKQYIVVAIICIIIIGGASLFTTIFVANQIKVEYKTLLTEAENDRKQNQRYVYVAMNDISAGDAITENNTKKVTVYSSQPQNSFITNHDFGQLALIDIPLDTQLIKTMLTETKVSSDLREVEYQILNINSNIISNDTIDVRIVFPNGESLVVLSKKIIKGITEGTVMCYLWLDPQEILKMSAAIVDAALYPGTRLITTKYIEPSIQDASEITYTPSLSILELLETDPNILERSSKELEKEVRKALENRLANSMSTDVSEINWDINPYQQNKATKKGVEDKIEDDKSEENKSEENKSEENKSEADKLEKDQSEKDITGKNKTEQDIEDDIVEGTDIGKDDLAIGELGSNEDSNYFYYAEEQEAKDGVMEYGE